MREFETRRIKYVANIFNGNSISDDEKDQYAGFEIPYIPTKEIDAESGIVNYENGLSVSKSHGFRIAPAESTLMCIEGGSAGRKITQIDREVAFVNKLCCFQPCKIEPSFLFFALQSADFLEQFKLNMTGMIGGVSVSALKNISISFPDLCEQKVISTQLKTYIAKANTLISNQKAQIEELKAYKQSLITEVVTKGLDPNVPMKDSRVEWIGKIPEGWNIKRIKNLFALRNERNEEADLKKVNLISLYTDLGVVQHSDLEETTGNKAVTAEGYKIVHNGDVVVNIILCWMGAVGKSNYDGVTSPAYDIYQPLNDTNSDYYHYLFRTQRFNGECYRYGRGIMMMRWRTYSAEFTSISVPVPSDQEQKQIVEYLNEKCSQIDKLISIKQQKIEKLNQYKKSLIYEYVTGKKEVVC